MSENRDVFKAELEEYKEMTQSSKSELGMKWFKFLIYFILFSEAAENLAQAVSLIFNLKIEYFQELFDLKYFDGDMRAFGIFFGFIYLIPAVSAVFIRFDLAKFKKGSPTKYIVFEIYSQIITWVYSLFIALCKLEGFPVTTLIRAFIAVTVGCVLGGFIYIYPNVVYFKNRKHLFIN